MSRYFRFCLHLQSPGSDPSPARARAEAFLGQLSFALLPPSRIVYQPRHPLRYQVSAWTRVFLRAPPRVDMRRRRAPQPSTWPTFLQADRSPFFVRKWQTQHPVTTLASLPSALSGCVLPRPDASAHLNHLPTLLSLPLPAVSPPLLCCSPLSFCPPPHSERRPRPSPRRASSAARRAASTSCCPFTTARPLSPSAPAMRTLPRTR